MSATLASGTKGDNNKQARSVQKSTPNNPNTRSIPVSSSSSSSFSATVSAAERILANAQYLNNLLTLIPAKAYFGQTENLEREPNISSKYLKNNAKQASIDQARKEASKKGQKRTRYEADAMNDHTVPGILLAAAQQKAVVPSTLSTTIVASNNSSATSSTHPTKSSPYGDLDEENNDPSSGSFKRSRTDNNNNHPQRATNIEELRQRLQAKIAQKQSEREGNKEKKENNKVAENKDKQKKDGKKDTLEKSSGSGSTKKATTTIDEKNKTVLTNKIKNTNTNSSSSSSTTTKQSNPNVTTSTTNTANSSTNPNNNKTNNNNKSVHNKNKTSHPTEKSTVLSIKTNNNNNHHHNEQNNDDFDTSAMDLAFSTISSSLPAELAVTTISTRPNLPQHGSKESTMKAMYAKAQRYQEALQRHENEGRKDKKLEMEFDHALRRAQGEAVKDDPTLIAKAMKRHQKEKAKSASEWAERKEKMDEEGRTRQQERKDNLANKKHRALKKGDRPDEPVNKRSNDDQQQQSSHSSSSSANNPQRNGNTKGSSSSSMNRPGFEGKKKGFINA